MHTAFRYSFSATLSWSRWNLVAPMLWGTAVVVGYKYLGLKDLALPALPLTLIGTAVAFYLGFKNNSAYDRVWEARKIYGAIVNASRSWTFSCRDLVAGDDDDLNAIHTRLVHRHIAWMDALRHQLRELKSWEHKGGAFERIRAALGAPERNENLDEILQKHLGEEEAREALAQINPAARLLANQSRDLARLRKRGLLDGFGHHLLQELLVELMTQQGKAERIKNFPFPRQYATVNWFFALIFCVLLPFGLLGAFAALKADYMIWATVPASGLVGWVFLTTDQIGEWSENPFEGLANDVPISSMSRGIERDIRQMLDEDKLPDPVPLQGSTQF